MKMYIQNYDIQKLPKKCQLIDKYYTSTRQTCMLYSSEGIFMVDETRHPLCLETWQKQ